MGSSSISYWELGVGSFARGGVGEHSRRARSAMCGFFVAWGDVDLSTYMLVIVGNVSARVILGGCEVSFVVCIYLCSDQVRAGPLCKEKRHLGARTQRRSGQFVFAAWISLFFCELSLSPMHVCVCVCV